MNPDTVVVYSSMPWLITILLMVNILLVGLAWWNFKKINQAFKEIGAELQKFLADRTVAIRLAEDFKKEFWEHTHDETGRVLREAP